MSFRKFTYPPGANQLNKTKLFAGIFLPIISKAHSEPCSCCFNLRLYSWLPDLTPKLSFWPLHSKTTSTTTISSSLHHQTAKLVGSFLFFSVRFSATRPLPLSLWVPPHGAQWTCPEPLLLHISERALYAHKVCCSSKLIPF